MPSTWKTVRVFISSTFRDMHAERDHLIKVVFPALRERLEKYRIYLIDIDLRWGVTREQAENDKVLDLCLQQIDECRPFFIGILGERYGWVPTRYPSDALKKFGWIQQHTGKSVTELEVIHGVLQNPQMRGRAFFYFRDPVAIQPVPEAIRRAVYAETERGQIEKLAELKRMIRYSGYPVMENYPARWDPEAFDRPSRAPGRLVGLEAFGERVRDQLWQAIQEEYQLPEQPPVETIAAPLAEELDYHERFMESRLRVYVGREQINDALFAFADGNDQYPCLVTGPSGSGKSAALARFVRDYQHKQPQTLVIPHFIGASPRSTNLRDMLRRFCQVLKARFGFAEDVPEEVAKLSVAFREFVGKVPADTRVLLVIDALNQQDEADRAQELYWLPTELPPQVKVIVSCISDSGKTEPVLKAFRWRQHCPVQLAALSDAEQRLIIRQVPSLSAKTLDDDQVRLLLSNPTTANPLFLLVALEELRGFAPYERLNERIAAFPREGDTVTAIFTQVIERLAEEFNQKLVETVLTLLASARRGLSEQELQELVVGLDGADDLFPVLRQLRPYLLSRAGLIDFYHRNLFKAVRERYLSSEQQQRQAHVRLAEYFNAQDYWLESREEQQRRAKTLPPTPRPANVRKVDELPWQLLKAADWQRSEQILTDLAFLEAKTEAGMVFDLVGDFGAVLGAIPMDRPLFRVLRLVEEALRRDIHFIAFHSQDYPQALFQCLWNTCWYDCSRTDVHYESPNQGWPAVGIPWDKARVDLSRLLQSWGARKAVLQPGLQWTRSLRPPTVHLGTGRLVLRGHRMPVASIDFATDGHRLVSASGDRTVRVWDAHKGAELAVLRGHEDCVYSVAFSPDGQRILSGSHDRTLRIWDAQTGAELSVIRGHTSSVRCVTYSPDGRWIVSGSEDRTARVWDAKNGLEIAVLRGHDYGVRCVAYSPDGKWIATASNEATARLWDAQTALQVAVLRGHKGEVKCVSFSPDSQWIVSSSGSFVFGPADNTIRVWDVRTALELGVLLEHEESLERVIYSPDGNTIACTSLIDQTVRVLDSKTGEEIVVISGHGEGADSLSYSPDGERLAVGFGANIVIWEPRSTSDIAPIRGHKEWVTSISYSPDGNLIASGSHDHTVRLWDTKCGEELTVLRGHKSWVNKVLFFPDGKRLVSASDDRTLRIWDAQAGSQLAVLLGHGEPVTCVAYSQDGNRIASGARDNTVRVWDARYGKQLLVLSGHEWWVNSEAFSPDGQRIASGSDDKTVRIWDTKRGNEIAVFRGHKGGVECISYSNNGRQIASGSCDRTVRVWDVNSGEELAVLDGHEELLKHLAYSSAGLRLASGTCFARAGSWDEAVRVWDARTFARLEHIPGKGDVFACAQGSTLFPWRAISRGLETVIEDAASRQVIARFPIAFQRIITHPNSLQWAAYAGNHIYIIALQGNGCCFEA